MAWVEKLGQLISAHAGTEVTETDLIRQLEAFRDECNDDVLRKSYPKDMHHFLRATGFPRKRTIDLVLSFLNAKYPGLHGPLIDEMVDALDRHDARVKPGDFEMALARERTRRGQSYWRISQERMRAKYLGCYALIRVSSSTKIQVEPFALEERPDDPTTLSLYWLCRNELLVGALLVNSYRFSGMILRKSTDAVIEPGSISLMRAAREPSRNGKLPLVMGGQIVGWKDDDAEALFHSRVAVVKLGRPYGFIPDPAAFCELIAQSAFVKCLERLRDPKVTDHLYWHFLKLESDVGHVDARNAFQHVTSELVNVTE